jgi:UDP-glucose 4-epimerase
MSRLLITGGTGSFGNEVLSQFIYKYEEIIIFSRDEAKQDLMRHKYKNHPHVSFFIGDVRNYSSIRRALEGVDYVFHASALKQVPSCEYFPMEAIQTNIIGTNNVLDAAEDAKVKRVCVLSMDKAVHPVNTMGMTKALSEKLMMAKAHTAKNTVFCGTRYGNVMASRGSVIPLFLDQIKAKKPLTVTYLRMTRFMMTLTDAVHLVQKAFDEGNQGSIYVYDAPAANMRTLAIAMNRLFNREDYDYEEIGIRPGEKIHETLISEDEVFRSKYIDDLYVEIHSGFTPTNEVISGMYSPLTSEKDDLTVMDMMCVLMKLPIIQEALK